MLTRTSSFLVDNVDNCINVSFCLPKAARHGGHGKNVPLEITVLGACSASPSPLLATDSRTFSWHKQYGLLRSRVVRGHVVAVCIQEP